jgi:hypothetical protein
MAKQLPDFTADNHVLDALASFMIGEMPGDLSGREVLDRFAAAESRDAASKQRRMSRVQEVAAFIVLVLDDGRERKRGEIRLGVAEAVTFQHADEFDEVLNYMVEKGVVAKRSITKATAAFKLA